MTKRAVTDEELMALADGELAPDAAERLHALVVADPDLAERFAILAETRFLLEGERAEAQAVPDHLPAAIAGAGSPPAAPRLSVIAGGKPAAPDAPPARRWPRLALPLAASFLFVAGGLAGYLAGGAGRSGAGIALAGFSRDGIDAALSRTASGGEATLPGGKLRVIASHKLGDGRLCREYTLARATEPGWDAVDCRDGGNWRTEFLAAKAAPAAGYAPASGDAGAEAFLNGRGAELVSPDEERRLLGGGK
ncbi:anti-sigma factor family protein [Bosea sp. NPDC003192]|uniref:anti-sigma factor family protein n=1 Tax=Bosea sp. NPDC003192 TaxID=3390551 RepID=UPI003D044ECA